MNLFSELYNCYFQVAKSLLEHHTLSDHELRDEVTKLCYEESMFFLLPKLTSKEWGLFRKEGEVWVSDLSNDFYTPLTKLQLSYLKAILMDEKIQLFLDKKEIATLQEQLWDVHPLWQPEDFYYFDRFTDHDDYSTPIYKKNFQKIMEAIKNHEYIEVQYQNSSGKISTLSCLPCRLEYSIKNDRFRILSIKDPTVAKPELLILNLSRILQIDTIQKKAIPFPNINDVIRSNYELEPVCLHIQTKRNALERAMLQFANYEKNTTKLDENTYECLIYYNKMVETELLIEVLSFGPLIKVVGNERFLKLLRNRLIRQKQRKTLPCDDFIN